MEKGLSVIMDKKGDRTECKCVIWHGEKQV